MKLYATGAGGGEQRDPPKDEPDPEEGAKTVPTPPAPAK